MERSVRWPIAGGPGSAFEGWRDYEGLTSAYFHLARLDNGVHTIAARIQNPKGKAMMKRRRKRSTVNHDPDECDRTHSGADVAPIGWIAVNPWRVQRAR